MRHIIILLLLVVLAIPLLGSSADEPVFCQSLRLDFEALTPAQIYDHFGRNFPENSTFYYDVRVPDGVSVRVRFEWYRDGRLDWQYFPDGHENVTRLAGPAAKTFVKGVYIDPDSLVRGIVVEPLYVQHPVPVNALIIACPPGGNPNAPWNDADGDGILNQDESCVNEFRASEPSIFVQGTPENCYSGAYYDSYVGVKGFPQNDGTMHVYGQCDAVNCAFIGQFDPRGLTPGAGVRFETGNGNWFFQVYHLGDALYQVNTYDGAGNLVDDHFQIIVHGDSYEWRRAG